MIKISILRDQPEQKDDILLIVKTLIEYQIIIRTSTDTEIDKY